MANPVENTLSPEAQIQELQSRISEAVALLEFMERLPERIYRQAMETPKQAKERGSVGRREMMRRERIDLAEQIAGVLDVLDPERKQRGAR